MNESEINQENYAGFWFRVIAAIVDGIISQIGAIIVVFPLAFALGASMAGTSGRDHERFLSSARGFLITHDPQLASRADMASEGLPRLHAPIQPTCS